MAENWKNSAIIWNHVHHLRIEVREYGQRVENNVLDSTNEESKQKN